MIKKVCYVVFLLLYLTSCISQFQVTSTQTQNIFPDQQTFTIVQDENITNLLGEETVSELKREIKRQMKERGFIHSEREPDLILFFTYYDRKVKLPELEQVNYNQDKFIHTVLKKAGTNTLVFQLLDVSSNEIVWRCFASNLPSQTQTRQYLHVTKWLFSELKFQNNLVIAGLGNR
jgi:hypothetical protein